MTGGTWRMVFLGLAVAGLALGYLGVEAGRLLGGDPVALYTDMAFAGAGVLALLLVFARLGRHFRDLERLHHGLSSSRLRTGAGTPDGNDEVGRLAVAVRDLLHRETHGPGRPADRLSGILAALEEPVIVLNDLGRVEVLNAPASWLLGVEAGGDIYDHLSRPELFRAIERARESGEVVPVLLRRAEGAEIPARVKDLGLQAGVVLVLAGQRGADQRPLLPGAGTVVLRPAARPAHLGGEEPLAALPMATLWVATTAPGPEEGRVVAVGTVRLAGPRVFRTVSLDLFVDPGEPVPAEATAAHGVTAAMVEGARPFQSAWPVIAQALRGCVVVGVGVETALDALARDGALAGLPEWERPPSLDLGRLAAALDPALAGASPDRLAAAFGIAPDRPAGPFAPALAQAELAAALLLRLAERGVATHGEARAFLEGRFAGTA